MAPSAFSVAQRVNAERLTVLAWPTAILMQLAHPLVAEGVYAHSTFRSNPFAAVRRLHATVRAMLDLSFGDAAARDATLGRIRDIHRRVQGRLDEPVGRFAAGTVYSAEDPALVLWVHMTLLDTLPRAFDTLVTPLGDVERDAYCAEAADVAVALGARATDVPTTWRALQDQLGRVSESRVLVVGPHARELADAVISPAAARWLGPLAWQHRLVTTGLLPPPLREQYGFEWGPARQRRFDVVVGALRFSRRLLPDVVAMWPHARRALRTGSAGVRHHAR